MTKKSAELWHITSAKYNAKANAVKETRWRNFSNEDSALKAFRKRSHLPLVLWHENAANLDNPYFAMIETDAYKAEYKKVKD